MKSKLMAGTATAALSLALCSHAASAATLDDVMQRLDKLEKENSELKQEVNQLRTKKATAPAPAPVAAAPAPAATAAEFKGNPVLHGAVAATPAPKPFLSIGGQPIITKAPGGWWVDNTTVTLYGHVDVSGDLFNPSVYDQGTKFGIASNSSYFGIRARHNLAPYGYDGYAFLAQFESQVDVASSPTEKAAFGTRDSFVGIEGPYGTIKAGKADTPYKKATAAFDPFANTVADYNSLMGNTGGDNRAEFDWRMNHAVWYESPIWKGFQFSAMVSPGQNYAPDNSDYAYGDLFQCNGASARGSGSNFPNSGGALPGNIGGNGCTDGSFGNAYSAAATYKNGPLTLIAAAELHEGVNRHADDGLEPGPFLAPVFLLDSRYDQVFPRIAREAGDCQFTFIQFPGSGQITALFRERLDRAFAGFGLNAADHCVFLPRLEPQKFVAAIGACDAVLDSIGWSGCNSVLESLVHDLPIVTLSGPLMRGRHATAILTMMDVPDTVTASIDGYVAAAVRIARDAGWRSALRSKIARNKHRLYRDGACIAALEDFLVAQARGVAPS
jgi:predicted porin